VTVTKPQVGDHDSQPNRSRVDSFRYRITFAKTVEMRYTSQLDVQRTFERLLRRAEVPTLLTKGFHPRIRFNLAAALPLGYTGAAEYAEVYLVDEFSIEELTARLRAAAPPGIQVREVERVESRGPAIQTRVEDAEYAVAFRDDVDEADLADAVARLLAADSIVRERRGKEYDLRPLIHTVDVLSVGEAEPLLEATRMSDSGDPGPGLRMRLATREGATGRPDEILLAMGLEPTAARICRLRVNLKQA
jgi:radical SAM-linked protein